MLLLLATIGGKEAPPPRYRSHKEVRALKITDVAPVSDGRAILSVEGGFAPITVVADVVRRYMPIDGDYLVFYDDGYRSISPRAPFEDGYDRLA